ncbi:hypothetical protein XELAEV_18018108mg [Xenopus laevis]|uniref:Uncharacterized protein n=1 Tax=Xenopus laevis TaxID=8355 RepID=A0A974DF66_XENLA|nr:hypothetical protein XELAEV_18018108mg [Xenopus laevis]
MYLDKYLFLVSALAICTSASHFLDQEWNAWKSKYEKKYISHERELFRRKIWEASWEKVQKHNQLADQGLKKYRLAMNQFADKAAEEHNSRTCFRSSKSGRLADAPVQIYDKNTEIPKEADWRNSKCVTPVRNQGELCGSCWAFSSVSVLESRYCIKKKRVIYFSEQQFVDCDEKNDGCCGGMPIDAFVHVAENGVMRRKDYEYTQQKNECGYNAEKAVMLNVTKFYSLPGEQNMAMSVALEGPITVAIGVSEELGKYEKGIFDGECAEEVNHAVTIVGYGTEAAKNEGEEDEDYWIIKNSWGKDWGENGYIRMKRNVNQCDIATAAATVDF